MARAAYTEYHIPRDGHTLYARSYAGANPALVLMHGFPDNLHIYDALAPLLAAAGRRTVVFDFLGYGGSDKPADYAYSTEGLEHDLQAVVDALELPAIVPVAHDASGPTAINWALDHPERVAALALLNTYYDEAPTLRFPELISLFSDPHYADLAAALAGAPAQLGWVLAFQGRQMYRQVSAPIRAARERNPVILPIVQAQFTAQPSVMPAFMRLTREVRSSVQANTMRRAGATGRKWTIRVQLPGGSWSSQCTLEPDSLERNENERFTRQRRRRARRLGPVETGQVDHRRRLYYRGALVRQEQG